MTAYTAWFDRKKGLFTIQDETGKPAVFSGIVLKQLTARSGQRGFENTNWTRGKSPIPYSDELLQPYMLYTHVAGPEYGAPDRIGGIGRFYPIATEVDRVTTRGKKPSQMRSALGLHFDNNWIARMVRGVKQWLNVGDRWKGSAGCVVLSVDTALQRRQGEAVMGFLDSLSAQGVQWIELRVV